ncbi:hypothetical protein GCM10018782_52720 [Streptomyces griseoaurantiacus]|nr:hypothetical protein GCM10018782_52720 [Streptomyces griseoaurantiacus]
MVETAGERAGAGVDVHVDQAVEDGDEGGARLHGRSECIVFTDLTDFTDFGDFTDFSTAMTFAL